MKDEELGADAEPELEGKVVADPEAKTELEGKVVVEGKVGADPKAKTELEGNFGTEEKAQRKAWEARDENDDEGARVVGSDFVEEEDEFSAFMNEVESMPVGGLPPPKTSNLLNSFNEDDEQAQAARVMAAFEIDDIKIEWGTGTEQVERIMQNKLSATHFELFLLPPYATEELIKKHYKKLSVLIHPDKCNHPSANEAFFLVTQAYEELLKPEYRAKYADVIGEARAEVLRERKKENKLRKQRGEELLKFDDDAIRAETIAKCDRIVKEREERLSYAERTKRENELRCQRMEAEEQAEEYRKQLEKKKWASHREERVLNWRDFRENVVTKKARLAPASVEQVGSVDYKKAWR